MTIEIRPFIDSDYTAALALWRDADGVVLRAADDRAPLVAYLDRNPGLSFIAEDNGRIVGAVLCGIAPGIHTSSMTTRFRPSALAR